MRHPLPLPGEEKFKNLNRENKKPEKELLRKDPSS